MALGVPILKHIRVGNVGVARIGWGGGPCIIRHGINTSCQIKLSKSQ